MSAPIGNSFLLPLDREHMIGKVDFNVVTVMKRLVSDLANSTISRLDEGLGLVARLKIYQRTQIRAQARHRPSQKRYTRPGRHRHTTQTLLKYPSVPL